MPFIVNVIKQLAKSLLIPLGLTAAASATDAAIHKKMFGPGATTLTISNEEMNDIMKKVKPLAEPFLLINSVSKTIKNEAKEQNRGFLGMLLSFLGDQEIYQQVKTQLEKVKEQQQRVKDKAELKQVRIFNATSSFNKF